MPSARSTALVTTAALLGGVAVAMTYISARIRKAPDDWMARNTVKAVPLSPTSVHFEADPYAGLECVAFLGEDDLVLQTQPGDTITRAQRLGREPVVRTVKQLSGPPLLPGSPIIVTPKSDACTDVSHFPSVHEEIIHLETPLGPSVASLYTTSPTTSQSSAQSTSLTSSQSSAQATTAPKPPLFVCVHGRGSTRKEFIKIAASLGPLGYHVLSTTYRNDYDGPIVTKHRETHTGATEHEDLTSAIEWAIDQGYSAIYLLGNSQGCSHIAFWLEEHELPPPIRGAILDSPLLSYRAAMHVTFPRERIPIILTPLITAMASWWTDIVYGYDLHKVEHEHKLGTVRLPMLMFHGQADIDLPIERTREFAAAHPNVTLVELDNAPHCCAWNAQPMTYVKHVQDLVRRTGG